MLITLCVGQSDIVGLIGYNHLLGVAWVQRCRSFEFDKLITFGVKRNDHVCRAKACWSYWVQSGTIEVCRSTTRQILEQVEKAIKPCVETAPQDSTDGLLTFGVDQ